MSHSGPSPALFFETVNAYQRTAALRTAIELEVFTHIAAGKHTADEIAAAAGAAPRGVRILADYLVILGFLEKQADRYQLTPDSALFLDRRSPAYVGGAVQFLLTPHMRECFDGLSDAVRRGGTAVSEEGTVSYDNPIWVDFARAMGPVMHMPAQLLAEHVGAPRETPIKVLDVAAGHGLFGIAVAQRYPQAQVTALDWANVVAVAGENAQRAGLAERHHVLAGSAFEVDWGGPYDVILLTNFLHHFDAATCRQLAARSWAALVPGGRAFTLEFIPNEDRVTPPITASFALTMLATTGRGDAYTFVEYERIFADAGFARSEFHPLHPTMQHVIVSYRAIDETAISA